MTKVCLRREIVKNVNSRRSIRGDTATLRSYSRARWRPGNPLKMRLSGRFSAPGSEPGTCHPFVTKRLTRSEKSCAARSRPTPSAAPATSCAAAACCRCPPPPRRARRGPGRRLARAPVRRRPRLADAPAGQPAGRAPAAGRGPQRHAGPGREETHRHGAAGRARRRARRPQAVGGAGRQAARLSRDLSRADRRRRGIRRPGAGNGKTGRLHRGTQTLRGR